MNTRTPKLLLAVTLAAALATGCGGGAVAAGGGAGSGSPGNTAPEDIGTSVSALLAYMTQLFAGDENDDPVDVNSVTLAVDDAADSSAVSF